MSEKIENFKDIKQIFASVLDQLKTWSDGQPIQNDINQQDVANAPLDPSRIDQTKPGGAGNHTKEDKFDSMTKQMTAIMQACMAMADQMDYMQSRMNRHNERIEGCMNAAREGDNHLHDRMDKHMGPNSGHLPAAKSPTQMAKAIKSLGLEGDYEVAKKTIYASKDLFEIKISSNS